MTLRVGRYQSLVKDCKSPLKTINPPILSKSSLKSPQIHKERDHQDAKSILIKCTKGSIKTTGFAAFQKWNVKKNKKIKKYIHNFIQRDKMTITI